MPDRVNCKLYNAISAQSISYRNDISHGGPAKFLFFPQYKTKNAISIYLRSDCVLCFTNCVLDFLRYYLNVFAQGNEVLLLLWKKC